MANYYIIYKWRKENDLSMLLFFIVIGLYLNSYSDKYKDTFFLKKNREIPNSYILSNNQKK